MNLYVYTMTQAVLALVDAVGSHPDHHASLERGLLELGVDLNVLRGELRNPDADRLSREALRRVVRCGPAEGPARQASPCPIGDWKVPDPPDGVLGLYGGDAPVGQLEAMVRTLCVSFAMLTCEECLKGGRPTRERVPGILTHAGPEVEKPSPLADCLASWIWSRTPPQLIQYAREQLRKVQGEPEAR